MGEIFEARKHYNTTHDGRGHGDLLQLVESRIYRGMEVAPWANRRLWEEVGHRFWFTPNHFLRTATSADTWAVIFVSTPLAELALSDCEGLTFYRYPSHEPTIQYPPYGAFGVTSKAALASAAKAYPFLEEVYSQMRDYSGVRSWVTVVGGPGVPSTQGNEWAVLAGQSWLLNLLLHSRRESLCVRLGCTTCGANEFKSLLEWVLAKAHPNLPPNFGAAHARMVLDELNKLNRTASLQNECLEDAVEFLDCISQAAIRNDERQKKPELMQEYRQRQLLEQKQREENALVDQENVRLAREQRKAERQEKHENRKKHFRELWLARQATERVVTDNGN